MKSERTCIACREKGDKSKFIKIVYNKSGEIKISNGLQLDGRGAYICKNSDCINKCYKSKALNRTFKTAIPQEFYEELIEKFGFR